ncbi:MAG: alpha/beta hydrolase-fold protein [Actinomycetota bacterium]|nr:alpha/beta hydrolase-fold protein [Actinomycetota bacterium]
MSWNTEQRRTTSESTGNEHVLDIGLPMRHGTISHPPLVICLDGRWTFGTTLDATRIMSMRGEAPEAVVVGVSFGPERMGEYLLERARWYTPTPFVPPAITGVKGLAKEETGRAHEFRAFLSQQVIAPFEEEFGTGERWLVGHSFSGLFGLSTLLAEPELFDKYLLASPSVWWDDRAALGLEERYAETHDDLPAHVFLSVGGEEDAFAAGEDAAVAESFRMKSNVEALAATLASRRYRSLRLDYAVLEGEGHNSTIGAAISRGLRALSK